MSMKMKPGRGKRTKKEERRKKKEKLLNEEEKKITYKPAKGKTGFADIYVSNDYNPELSR